MKKLLLIIIFNSLFFAGYSQSNYKIVIEPLLKTDTSYAGQKLVYPSGDSTETTIAKVIVPPGASTDWHMHDYPLYGYLIQGELTVERKGYPPFLMKAGSAYAEVIGTWHNGTNTGKVDCVFIVFSTGVRNHPLSVKRTGF
jgi:quercetin dioxygenase-like cupin family protein